MSVILNGKIIAESLRDEIASQTARFRSAGVAPKLAVVMVGDDPASALYAKAKERACQKTEIDFQLFNFPTGAPETTVVDLIRRLNQDNSVHGIMVELPLPPGLDKKSVLGAVAPIKDVDGVHPVNRGLLLSGGDGLFPVTPQSCIEIILRSGLAIAGKHAVLIGRGETVGKPLVFMMLGQNATVTVCHTKTPDLGHFARQADIMVVAVGRPNTITGDMIKPGAIVVDAGINETPSGICGDVNFEQAREVAGAISPVPGGVGSLTTVLLQKNLLKAVQLQMSQRTDRKYE